MDNDCGVEVQIARKVLTKNVKLSQWRHTPGHIMKHLFRLMYWFSNHVISSGWNNPRVKRMPTINRDQFTYCWKSSSPSTTLFRIMAERPSREVSARGSRLLHDPHPYANMSINPVPEIQSWNVFPFFWIQMYVCMYLYLYVRSIITPWDPDMYIQTEYAKKLWISFLWFLHILTWISMKLQFVDMKSWAI